MTAADGPSIDRRSAALLALRAPFAAVAAASAQEPLVPTPPSPTPPSPLAPPPIDGARDIAMLVYPGLTALDLVGPQYMFAALDGMRVHLVGRTLAPVTSDTGLVLTPTLDFAACPADLAVLFAPGGTDGTLAAMRDADTLAFLADRGARAGRVASVCTGSLLLGAAGLLRGYRATSHWAALHVLAGFGAVPTDARVVRDRDRITGAGVTAGLDLGLAMLADLAGDAYAELVQLGCEYDPQPPFAAGSPRTAPPAVTAEMTRLLSGFVAAAGRLAAERPPGTAPT